MKHFIVAMRSRSQTIKFSETLRSMGIPCEVINTPKEVGVGCGLSTKVSSNYYYAVKKVLSRISFSSLAGLFEIKMVGSKRVVVSIK